jgi:hypothetical protein
VSATDWGLTFETHIADRAYLKDVAHDGGADQLVDARSTADSQPVTAAATRQAFARPVALPDGARVGVKVTRYRISDAASSRRGRYYLPRAELDRVDAFAFGVYHPDHGILEDAIATVGADVVATDLVTSWTDSPHRDYDLVTRPPWSRVFNPAEVRLP